jgi:hypothetical protein
MRVLAITKWLAVPVFFGAVAFAAKTWSAGQRPALDAPETVDLGIKAAGTYVHVAVPVRNAGTRSLELTDLAASCGACTRLTEGVGETEQPLKQATVAPGETFLVRVRMVIAGKPDSPISRFIDFRTNDPDAPRVRVTFTGKVEGGLSVFPETVDLGTLSRGKPVTKTVEVRDTGLAVALPIVRVESTDGERVRVISFQRCDRPVAAGQPLLGKVVACAEIAVAAPDQPGRLDAELRFFAEGTDTPVLTVPVRGELRPILEVIPPAVILPYVSAGEHQYSMNCIVRGTDGRPFRLATESVPDGVSAQGVGDPQESRTTHCVKVEWRANRPARGEVETRVVHFVAKFENGTEPIDLSVKCRCPD